MLRSIALVGEFASGKTTLTNELIRLYGYRHASFAGALKWLASEAYGDIRKDDTYRVTRLNGEDRDISGRQLLQELGQSVKAMDRDFWVKVLLRELDHQYDLIGDGWYVLDDCRFPYEADALRERGWQIVRIATPSIVRYARYEEMYGRPPNNQEMMHPSEMEVPNIRYDMRVDGTASPADLARLIVEGRQ